MKTTDTTVTRVYTVDSREEVQEQAAKFRRDGYEADRIFVLTHDKTRTNRIAEQEDVETIGVAEEGLGTAIANLFRSTGDELRAKMQSLGISEGEAARLEEEMDRDRIVVIAWGGKEYLDDEFDHDVYYHPYPGFHHAGFPHNQPPFR